MGVLQEYHEALGDLIFRFEGTLERFTGDGLMVFFNDPMPMRRRPLRARADGVAMRDSGAWPGGGLGRARGTTWRWESGSRRATRRWERSGSRDGWTTRPSATSPTSRPGCVEKRSPGRSSCPSGLSPALDPRSWPRTSGAQDQGIQPTGPCLQHQGTRHCEDSVMSGDLWTAPASATRGAFRADRGGEVQPVRRSPVADGRGLGGNAAQLRRRVGGRHSIDHARPGGRRERKPDRRRTRRGSCSSCSAAAAAAADGLRDLDADRSRDRGVLPGAAARGHPEPCQGTAVAWCRSTTRPRAR